MDLLRTRILQVVDELTLSVRNAGQAFAQREVPSGHQ